MIEILGLRFQNRHFWRGTFGFIMDFWSLQAIGTLKTLQANIIVHLANSQNHLL